MKRERLFVDVNQVSFYCELRGEGSLVVLHPDGSNDCGAYEKLADILARHHRVLSFDPRGSVRSVPQEDLHVTAAMLADDMAGILDALDLGPAVFFGCSSGGQAVLNMAYRYPEKCIGTVIHEAALQSDTPLPEAGFRQFAQAETYAPYCNGFAPGDLMLIGDYDKFQELDAVTRSRMAANDVYWAQYYIGTADKDSWSAEQLSRMKNVFFSTGVWSSAWIAYANIETARRGGFPHTWLMCAHEPHITCPEELAAYIENCIAQCPPEA